VKPEKTERNAQVVAARAAGWTVSQIAEAAHLARSRVRAILAMQRRRAAR